MPDSGIGLVGAVPAVTVAAIVAEVLAAPLPQPDYVGLFVSTTGVSMQFSPNGSGAARFGYVREWADRYGVEVTRSGRFHKAVFSVMGIEFEAYAAEPEQDR